MQLVGRGGWLHSGEAPITLPVPPPQEKWSTVNNPSCGHCWQAGPANLENGSHLAWGILLHNSVCYKTKTSSPTGPEFRGCDNCAFFIFPCDSCGSWAALGLTAKYKVLHALRRGGDNLAFGMPCLIFSAKTPDSWCVLRMNQSCCLTDSLHFPS